MQQLSTSPIQAIRLMMAKRSLIWQFTKRDVVGRYRGSVLGLLWSFFNPLLMLTVYTFVFGYVFKARWGTGGSGSKAEFAVTLFAGMIVFQIFAECINKAPSLIVSNPNFVKKVVFPLEILPVVTCLSALFHAAVSAIVLIIGVLVVKGGLSVTMLLWPLVLLPFSLMVLGLSWFLASLGVFIRDIAQSIGLITVVFNFMSPVFYPASALPAPLRKFLFLNPVTYAVEQSRAVLINGQLIDVSGFAIYSIASVIVFALGLMWFQRSRKGFADVL
ncbi:ABC transporter permease [Burkholderia sp. AU33545]|uniref:ABC transporter permease n=1 Tax=Burkholderia sp. AU33545 TaxID=2879631 RepID=UPI001CF35173|nr:ABC transporter permease [Burkholderia sp. AU33545]MCA8199747.1 ABC transporter permease [Burkholderia sp. AU33545]